MKLKPAQRIEKLTEYPFKELDKLKSQMQNVLDLSMGDPDIPPPEGVVEILKESLNKQDAFRYPTYEGKSELRQAVADFYKKEYQVELSPENEVLPLLGTKEGIAHLPLAILNKKDLAIIPIPCYPPYIRGVYIAEGECYFILLKEENDYLIDLGDIPDEVTKKAKYLLLNYPNNPTTATAPLEFFKDLIKWAKRYDILICQDLAYGGIYFDGKKPPSILEVEGAKEIACEFFSVSKLFSLAGFRVGFLVGNSKVISYLLKLKTNIDSGIFNPIQDAVIYALRECYDYVEKIKQIYKERRDILFNALKESGWKVKLPLATFYIWAKQKQDSDAKDIVLKLLKGKGILATPSNAFFCDSNYIRFSLSQSTQIIKKAALVLGS